MSPDPTAELVRQFDSAWKAQTERYQKLWREHEALKEHAARLASEIEGLRMKLPPPK